MDGKTNNLTLVSDFLSWNSASLITILNHSLVQDCSSSNLPVIKSYLVLTFITISLKDFVENEKKCIFQLSDSITYVEIRVGKIMLFLTLKYSCL